jgi:hypothetical protein
LRRRRDLRGHGPRRGCGWQARHGCGARNKHIDGRRPVHRVWRPRRGWDGCQGAAAGGTGADLERSLVSFAARAGLGITVERSSAMSAGLAVLPACLQGNLISNAVRAVVHQKTVGSSVFSLCSSPTSSSRGRELQTSGGGAVRKCFTGEEIQADRRGSI